MGIITAVQRFSTHDGPGIRTTVFLKGCPLRCYWCHNPETQNPYPELMFWKEKCISCGACKDLLNAPTATRAAACYSQALVVQGEELSAEELVARVLIDRNVFRRSGGGITFSGGEPFLQSDFLHRLLKHCRAEGVHTAVESAVSVPYDAIAPCLPYIDLLYCDLKTTDPQKHREGCGTDNTLILQNIRTLCRTELPIQFRTPIIPDFNDNEESVRAIVRFLREAGASSPPELLEFHNYCANKYRALGRTYAASALHADKERLHALRTFAEKEWNTYDTNR